MVLPSFSIAPWKPAGYETHSDWALSPSQLPSLALPIIYSSFLYSLVCLLQVSIYQHLEDLHKGKEESFLPWQGLINQAGAGSGMEVAASLHKVGIRRGGDRTGGDPNNFSAGKF